MILEEDAVSLNVVNSLFRPMLWGGIITIYAVYDTIKSGDGDLTGTDGVVSCTSRAGDGDLNRGVGLVGVDVKVLMYTTCRK